ncbi:hypothetical protein JXL21_01225 [Candidatus Bathyarchaeota archaeon]|nr:hypothetical protein [Candidatus Bathyarchaeota archaeon]
MWIPVVARLLNGLVTLYFLPYLLGIYRRRQRRFYLYWGLGFLLYGVNNLIRTWMLYAGDTSIPAELAAFTFQSLGFTLIICGIGELIDRARLLCLASLGVPLLMALLYLTSRPILVAQVIALAPYLFICACITLIRLSYDIDLDLLVIGWWIILLINVGYMFGYVGDVTADAFSVFGKAVIFYGMTKPKFTLLAEDFEQFLLGGHPRSYPEEAEGYIMMVESNTKRRHEMEWLRKKVQANSLAGVRTILVIIYDLLSMSFLKEQGLLGLEGMYVIRMLSRPQPYRATFSTPVMEIGDDLGELSLLLSDIEAFTADKKTQCQIIIYDISTLVHINGWNRVYTFLISNVHKLKRSRIATYIIYYPETHTNSSEVETLRHIGDRVVEIKA